MPNYNFDILHVLFSLVVWLEIVNHMSFDTNTVVTHSFCICSMSGSDSDNSVEQVQVKRLFVGGLFPEVNDEELKSRFGRFGSVKGTEIKIRKDSNGIYFTF